MLIHPFVLSRFLMLIGVNISASRESIINIFKGYLMRPSARKLSMFLALLAGLVTFTANADRGMYVGFGVGNASYKADPSRTGSDTLEEDGTGTKLYMGHAYNDFFAFELAAYNFAEASVGAYDTGSGFVSAAVSMRGAGLFAVGMYPLSREFKLMAKGGIVTWNADLRVDDTTVTNDGDDLAFGVAASYAFTRELSAVAEWETINSKNPDLAMLSLGFLFKFR